MFLSFLALGGPSPPGPAGEEEIQRLVRAASEGDGRAARRLYTHFVARVYRAVLPLCTSEAEAEDVVQETFVKAFRALDRYERREGARFVSWLLAIARNTTLETVRRADRAQPTEPSALDGLRDREGLDGEAGPQVTLELRSVLLRALRELPERERSIVCLRYGAELDVAEVSRLCDVSEANVRKICERQRRHLEERLDALLAEGSSPEKTDETNATENEA